MNSIQHQSVGVDISKSDFHACICYRDSSGGLSFSDTVIFKNDKTGINQFIRWVRKHCDKKISTSYLLEATGVYHESLAYHLDKLKLVVYVVLPNKSHYYFKSLNIKSKTDALDARILSRYGVEHQHVRWHAPNPILLELRQLTRYYAQLQERRTDFKNIQESHDHSYATPKILVNSLNQVLKKVDKELSKTKHHIQKCLDQSALKSKSEKLLSIKGAGLISVATVIAETQGFALIKSIKQLSSYAGYDVVHHESGSSVLGKARISKKGNKYIRKALYFPAMVACVHNPDLKKKYQRIIKNKASKMIGQVAIQRNLLGLMYTLWKNDTYYIEGYQK